MCLYTYNVCSVTSEPTQSSSRRVLSLKDSPQMLYCVPLYNICGEASALLYGKEQSF